MVGSIDREVRAFVGDLRENASQLAATMPDSGLKVYQAPDRILLQAGDVGVTVSLFRSRAGEAAGAEVILGIWKGTVVFPGTTPFQGQRAQQLHDRRFQIAATPDEAWVWHDNDPEQTLSSSALAAICVDEMAGRLTEIAEA